MQITSLLLLKVVIPGIAALASSVLSFVGLETARWIRTKTKNEKINDALTHITETTKTVVSELKQTTADKWKEMSEDGKLTEEDAIALKNAAIEKIKSQTPALISKTAKLGVTSIDEFISGKIEQVILDQKGKR
jgi:hypothetical protein